MLKSLLKRANVTAPITNPEGAATARLASFHGSHCMDARPVPPKETRKMAMTTGIHQAHVHARIGLAGFVSHVLHFGGGMSGRIDPLLEIVMPAQQAEQSRHRSIGQPQKQTRQINPSQRVTAGCRGEKHDSVLPGGRH